MGRRAGDGAAGLDLTGCCVCTQASLRVRLDLPVRVVVAEEVELWKKITGVGTVFVAGVFLNWLASCVPRRCALPPCSSAAP